jgi:hypothetical protein
MTRIGDPERDAARAPGASATALESAADVELVWAAQLVVGRQK